MTEDLRDRNFSFYLVKFQLMGEQRKVEANGVQFIKDFVRPWVPIELIDADRKIDEKERVGTHV